MGFVCSFFRLSSLPSSSREEFSAGFVVRILARSKAQVKGYEEDLFKILSAPIGKWLYEKRAAGSDS